MWCFVSQPNGVVIEVELSPKSTGQDCLEKVCHKIGVIEEDYFGLQYRGSKGEDLWLNLRNQIHRQVKGQPPYRFALRAKFWVPPHLILQDTTRHLFYQHARLDLTEGRLKIPSEIEEARVGALMAQAELGDYNGSVGQMSVYPMLLAGMTIGDASLLAALDNNLRYKDNKPQVSPLSGEKLEVKIRCLADEHAKIQGTARTAAEYWVLKEASNFEGYGQEFFHARNSPGILLGIGVGPQGITLYYEIVLMNDDGSMSSATDTHKQIIPFTAVQNATCRGKSFILVYANAKAETITLDLKLDSVSLAQGLYRAVTEKHAFYSCETVRSAVTSQFVRDLKGTIASLFNENTALGKNYMFDIKRTCREVYDNARRSLYHAKDVCAASSTEKDQTAELRQYIANVQDEFLCRACMDREIDCAFCPCGHVACCSECASRCERCPLCRADIERTQTVFLPGYHNLMKRRMSMEQ